MCNFDALVHVSFWGYAVTILWAMLWHCITVKIHASLVSTLVHVSFWCNITDLYPHIILWSWLLPVCEVLPLPSPTLPSPTLPETSTAVLLANWHFMCFRIETVLVNIFVDLLNLSCNPVYVHNVHWLLCFYSLERVVSLSRYNLITWPCLSVVSLNFHRNLMELNVDYMYI